MSGMISEMIWITVLTLEFIFLTSILDFSFSLRKYFWADFEDVNISTLHFLCFRLWNFKFILFFTGLFQVSGRPTMKFYVVHVITCSWNSSDTLKESYNYELIHINLCETRLGPDKSTDTQPSVNKKRAGRRPALTRHKRSSLTSVEWPFWARGLQIMILIIKSIRFYKRAWPTPHMSRFRLPRPHRPTQPPTGKWPFGADGLQIMILISKSISFYKRAVPTIQIAGIQRSRPPWGTYLRKRESRQISSNENLVWSRVSERESGARSRFFTTLVTGGSVRRVIWEGRGRDFGRESLPNYSPCGRVFVRNLENPPKSRFWRRNIDLYRFSIVNLYKSMVSAAETRSERVSARFRLPRHLRNAFAAYNHWFYYAKPI